MKDNYWLVKKKLPSSKSEQLETSPNSTEETKDIDFLEQTDVKNWFVQSELNSASLPLSDRTIIEFMCSTGCRIEEVRKLNVKDISLKERTATVTGKGEKHREIFFPLHVSELIQEYLKNRPTNEGELFLSKTGKPIPPKS